MYRDCNIPEVPLVSDAVVVTSTLPETLAPLVGFDIFIVGGGITGAAALETVSATPVDTFEFPAAS